MDDFSQGRTMGTQATECPTIDEIVLCPPEPTAPPTTTVPTVTYPVNVCEPGTYPASVEAVGDPTQCVTVDPCSPDGTSYWTFGECTPELAPVAVVGVRPELPSTGPAPYAPTIGMLALAVVMLGALAVRVARCPRP